MILADTSIWVEYLKTKSPVFATLRVQLEQQNIVAVECIFGELLQGTKRSRERTIILQYWNNLPKRDEQGLCLEAGSLSQEYDYLSKGIGLIDSFLIVVARKYHVQIWTLDKKLLSALETNEIFTPPI